MEVQDLGPAAAHRKNDMGNKASRYWVIASILAGVLWAACSRKAEEKAQPGAFNSAVPFEVFSERGGALYPVGTTPSAQPLMIPASKSWYVEPVYPVDMEKVRQEVEARKIPGLQEMGLRSSLPSMEVR